VCLCGHRTRNLLDREGYRELGCVAEGPSSPRAGVEIELTKNVKFIVMAVGDDDAIHDRRPPMRPLRGYKTQAADAACP
jgi:hypothetical protein